MRSPFSQGRGLRSPFGMSVAPAAPISAIVVDEPASEATGVVFADILDGGVPYRLATFATTSQLFVTTQGAVEYLLVGGAAGGGDGGGGGGGGGGGRVVPGSITLPAGTYPVVIGAGGLTDGDDTTAFGLTALGGGAGGSDASLIGGAGGSGGGGRWTSVPGTDGAADATYGGLGHRGGDGGGSTYRGGGGGGGAETAGSDAPLVADGAGDGGDGVLSTITGASLRYGAGGGGAARDAGGVHGSGGLGGGGDGGQTGGDGLDGRGSGGGGGSGGGAGAGGNGVVHARWPR